MGDPVLLDAFGPKYGQVYTHLYASMIRKNKD